MDTIDLIITLDLDLKLKIIKLINKLKLFKIK